jgi:hypothetical protein
LEVIMFIRSRLLSFAASLAAALFLSACGGGSGGTEEPAPPATADILAGVQSTIGATLQGVTVSVVGTAATAQTDANGAARLSALPRGQSHALKFSKDGFAEQFKLVAVGASTASAVINVQMLALQPFQSLADAAAGGSLSGKDGAKIELPAAALVNATGQAVTGAVQISLTPVNVTTGELGGFPGAFEGVPQGGARGALESYGTTFYELRQNGQKLNLAAGKTATIELPLYVTQGVSLGSSIALWSLNETTAVWQQEGTDVVVASTASPSGLALRATVSHFSPWNADRIQSDRGTLNISFQLPTGFTLPPSVSLTALTTDAGPAWTSTGQASAPLDTFPVPANRNLRLAGLTTLVSATGGSRTARGSVTARVTTGQTTNVIMQLDPVTLPAVRILNPSQAVTSVNGSTSTLTVDVKLDSEIPFQTAPVPERVQLLANGAVVGEQAPDLTTLNRFAWNLSGLADGTYTLVGRAILGPDRADSLPRTVVIDRTGPRMASFTPAANVEVDRNTTFTVDFNEPVNPLPFSLNEIVKFTVLPVGATTPVEIAATLALNVAGTRLTVTPTAALPIGVAGLSWAGLKDAAANPITGTVALTWNVSRSSQIGSDIQLGGNLDAMAMAADANVVAHVLARTAIGSGDLQLRRFDGNQFVPLGPIVNERAVAPSTLTTSMAIDRSGNVFVAFTQRDSANLGVEVVVRRYVAATNIWQTVVAPFAMPVNNLRTPNPALAIDSLNRLVLGFLGGSDGRVLQAHRFDGTAWSALGSIPHSVNDFTLAIQPNNQPVMAFLSNPGPFATELRVSRHDGNAWVALGGALDGVGDTTQGVSRPALAIAGDGQPWVVWRHGFSSAPAINNIARFDGTAFVAVPTVPNAVLSSALCFLNGDPVLVSEVRNAGHGVHRLRNGIWEPAAFIAAQPGGDIGVTLAPAPSNSVLIAISSSVGRVTRFFFP